MQTQKNGVMLPKRRKKKTENAQAEGVIGEKQIAEAEAALTKYKSGKANLEERVKNCVKLFRLMSWEVYEKKKNDNDPMPASAYLFNSLINKHADAMDNIPTLNVLPREAGDKADAEMLSGVLPAIFDQNKFTKVYSEIWWDKLIKATAVWGVFWDTRKLNGIGDIDIRAIDILNLYWEPGIKDVQKSKNLFNIDLMDRDMLQQMYPNVELRGNGSAKELAKYTYEDNVDTTNKVIVVDWYYKQRINGREIVQLCKYACGKVLYASENVLDKDGIPVFKERGYYDHGKYPFVIDTTFPLPGSPSGMGYADVCKNPQEFIDVLDQAILQTARWNSKTRYFETEGSGINNEDFLDDTKTVVKVKGSRPPSEMLMEIAKAQLPAECMVVRQMKVDELKEVSGNRDFTQGSVTAGVTAASAIATLVETGSKPSRDMIGRSFDVVQEIGVLALENVRQFYTEMRIFRIIGENGEMQFKQFNNQRIKEQQQEDGNSRVPIFDIKVVAQKQSPFSTIAQNERAKEFFAAGFFRPDLADQAYAALGMMQFEGIEQVRQKISQNGLLHKKLMQLTPLILAMAQELDSFKPENPKPYTPQIVQILNGGTQQPPNAPDKAVEKEAQGNAIGDIYNDSKSSQAGEARKRAAAASTPRA